MFSTQPNPREFLADKRTAVLQIFSLIDSLQPILLRKPQPIEPSEMQYIEAGLTALIEELTTIDKVNYQLYIEVFAKKLLDFKTFYSDKYAVPLPPFKHADGKVSAGLFTPKTLPSIPTDLAQDISEHLNLFKLSNQDFLTQTMRPKNASTMLLAENLATNLTLALERTPKFTDPQSLVTDWSRDEFAVVNGESFNFYKRHFPYRPSLQMIKNFCCENGLDETQTSFVLSQAHQHALGGLLAYVLDPFRNNLAEKRIQYSPTFIDGNMISIKGRMGQPLLMNCRAILYVKNMINSNDIIPLAHVGFTVTAHDFTIRYPEILGDSQLVPRNCFIPTRTTIKLQFAFVNKPTDPFGLKQLFRETVVCGANHIASISETSLPSPETSLMFEEPALVPLILDREF